MSSIWKGLLLGVANVWLVAFVVGSVDLYDGRSTDMTMIIAIFGLGPGLAVGALAGYIAGQLPVFRRSALATIALASVIGLGVMTDPALITRAIPSTLILSLVLEWWSRSNLAAHGGPTTEPRTVSPVWTGMWLGMANAIAVGVVLGIHASTHRDDFSYHLSERPQELAILISCLGIVPGAGIGAALGAFTKSLRDLRPVMRVLLIGVLAAGSLVVALGLPSPALTGGGDALPMIPPALFPTMIAVLILERRTRPLERMPAARALA